MLSDQSLQRLVNSFAEQRLPDYLVVATLFNELKATKRAALQLFLCSRNARAISIRSGDWGRSFSGVTSFIDESAGQMVALAEQIGDLAKGMTNESVSVLQEQQLAEKLGQIAKDKLDGSTTLMQLRCHTKQVTEHFHEKHDEDIHKLKRLLDEIKSCNRFLNAIVSTCKTEASRAGPFQEALLSIAESMNSAVGDLEDQIKMGDKLMTLLSSHERRAIY